MKNQLKTLTFTLILAFFFGMASEAQDKNTISSGIVNATRNGDAKKLAEYFNENIELVLPRKSGIFSKSQAEMVLKEFFVQNPPEGFRIIHEGSRQNASFAIGNYTSGKEVFRIYYLTKNANNKLFIHQLRIEKQNE